MCSKLRNSCAHIMHICVHMHVNVIFYFMHFQWCMRTWTALKLLCVQVLSKAKTVRDQRESLKVRLNALQLQK